MPRNINNPNPLKKSQFEQLDIMSLIGWTIADIDLSIPSKLIFFCIPENFYEVAELAKNNQNNSPVHHVVCCALEFSGEWAIEKNNTDRYIFGNLTTSKIPTDINLKSRKITQIQFDQNPQGTIEIGLKNNVRINVPIEPASNGEPQYPLIFHKFS